MLNNFLLLGTIFFVTMGLFIVNLALPSAYANFSYYGWFWSHEDPSSAYIRNIFLDETDSTITANVIQQCGDSICSWDDDPQYGYRDGNLGVIIWDKGWTTYCMILIVVEDQLTVKTIHLSATDDGRLVHTSTDKFKLKSLPLVE